MRCVRCFARAWPTWGEPMTPEAALAEDRERIEAEHAARMAELPSFYVPWHGSDAGKASQSRS